MRLACLCPTYKRPEMLANALACFLGQTYDRSLCRLFILDDAGQHVDANCYRWEMHTQSERLPDLPTKFNALAKLADEWKPDGYVVWEDDDVFFPWHLEQIAAGFQAGVRYWRTPTVFSDYGQSVGWYNEEGAAGRFHGSWAYRKDLWDELDGYTLTTRLEFDQIMGGRCRSADPQEPALPATYFPGYCYRWGKGGWNGSQSGEGGFAAFWDSLGKLPAPHVPKLVAHYDHQTTLLMDNIGAARHRHLEMASGGA